MHKYKIPQVVTLIRRLVLGLPYKIEKALKNQGFYSLLSTPSGIRTLDPLIKSQLLYQLS